MNLREIIENNSSGKINLSNFIIDDVFYSNISKYIAIIKKWGIVHNIVSGKFIEDDVILSIYDSLAGASFLSLPSCVYDAGSGGGFPGMVLAIASPAVKFVLVEANRKKCSFLRMVKAQLLLKNVEIKNERIESLSDVSFIVTKAAFSPPNIGMLADVLRAGGKLAIWATEKNRSNFLDALNLRGIKIVDEYAYEILGIKRRLILLLEKEA